MRLIDADELIVMEFSGIKFVPKEFIDDAPTIEPEQKKGKWKREYLTSKEMGERLSIFYCSECNQCIAYPVNFCPSCGARMGGLG